MYSLFLKMMVVALGCMLIGMPLMAGDNPKVLFKTSMGDIELELYPDKAPNGVANFLNYVREGFYNNTIFHRVIKGFVIQGGGFDNDTGQKEPGESIINEATNGLKNKRGAICYARTNEVHSATSQFFINHRDNTNLDHRDTTPQGYGYAVFGKVVKGMDVVDKIANVKTGKVELQVLHQGQSFMHLMSDVPIEPVLIISATVAGESKDENK